MSQSGILNVSSSNPEIALEYVTDSGTAIPSANILNIVGVSGLTTVGSGNTISIGLGGGSLAIDSIHPDSGTDPVVPDSNALVNMVGSGSITTVGSLNTLTTQLTGLTDHAVLVGAGTSTITKLPIGTTGQVLTGNTAADPSWTTLSSIGVTSITGTANQITASASTGAVTLSFPNGISIGSYQAISPPTGGIITPGNVGIGISSPSNTLDITRASATTSGIASYLAVTQVADTDQTASTESPTILFDLSSADRSWADGNIATQRYVRIKQPEFAFTNAFSTNVVTSAATVGIDGSPSHSGFLSGVDNSHALLISSASVGTSVGNSYGLTVNAQTGAANNYAAQFIGGNVGIGTATPTAVLQIKAGTATASTAPLKFTSGTNLTAAEAGAVEWDGTTLFLTNSVPTRQAVSLMSSSFLTNHGVVLGAGTATLSVTAAGTTGQVLIGNTGADPTWGTLSSIAVTSITGTANQIAASASTGAVTLSLTNGISIGSYQATASPTGGIIAPGNVGVGTNSPSYLVHAYGSNKAIVIEDPNALGSASLRAWASQDGTPATNGDAILQLAGKQSAAIPDNCWYIGLDGSTGAGNFDPNLKIGFSSGWAVPGAGDKVTILTSGLVGIATTSPAQTLTVAGAVGITGNSNLPAATGSSLFLSGAFGSPVLGRIFVGDGTGWYLALSKRLASVTTDLFYFLDSGKIGIGTAAPLSTLGVAGNTSIGATYAAIAAPTNGLIVEGSIAINNSSPSARFQLDSSGSYTGAFSGSSKIHGINVSPAFSYTGAVASDSYGIQITPSYTPATGTTWGNIYGVLSTPYLTGAGTGTVSSLNGGYFTCVVDQTGSISSINCLTVDYPDISNATVTNVYCIQVGARASTGATITNSYGIHVATPTTGTNKYTAILGTSSTAKVGIGTATPVNQLDVGAGAVIGASVAGATTAPTNGLIVQGSLVMNTAALATNATDGFIYESTCAGTPTGAPTANTGRSAIVIDTTNNIPYFYNSSWKCANGKVLINSNVLGASAATVTFSSIPGVFNHLTIKGIVRCTNAATFATIYMQFNGDTGANYNRQFMRVRNATFSGGCAVAVTQAYIADVCASTAAANYASNFVTSINCYSQTTFYKVYNTAATNLFSTAADSFTESWSGSWANTAAITSITFGELAGGSIDAGSAFYIYGEI